MHLRRDDAPLHLIDRADRARQERGVEHLKLGSGRSDTDPCDFPYVARRPVERQRPEGLPQIFLNVLEFHLIR